MTEDIESLKAKLREYELKEQKRKIMIDNTIPTCQICYEQVECPVTFNAWDFDNHKQYKCSASQCNPVCLLCARTYIDNMKKSGRNTFKCLYNCCEMVNKGYMTYGELGRNPEDVPEPTLYRSMKDNGVTVCRRCNTDCVTVYNLATHIKSTCPKRKLPCYVCKKLFEACDLPRHHETCYFKCQYCGEKLPHVGKNENLQHICKKKPIFNCKFCSKTFDTETIFQMASEGKMHICCKLYKNESVPSTGSRIISQNNCTNVQGLAMSHEELESSFTDFPGGVVLNNRQLRDLGPLQNPR